MVGNIKMKIFYYVKCIYNLIFRCGKELIIDENLILNDKKKFIDEFNENLNNTHDYFCPWFNNPLPFSHINPGLLDKEEIIDEYNIRKDNIKELKDDIPIVTMINSNNLSKIPSNSIEEISYSVLSLYGWDIIINNNRILYLNIEKNLYCKYCNSKRSLNLFIQKKLFDNNKLIDIMNSKELQKQYEDKYKLKFYNPNIQHRWYCPFIYKYDEYDIGYLQLYKILYGKEIDENEQNICEIYTKSINLLNSV